MLINRIPYVSMPMSAQTLRKPQTTLMQKMAIGVAANSCTTGQTGSAAIGGEEWDDRGKNSGLENGPRNGLEKGERNDDAAVEQRRVRDAEGMHLVALEPGQHVGPYRLQVNFAEIHFIFLYAAYNVVSP